eukprot:Opistho-2@85369
MYIQQLISICAAFLKRLDQGIETAPRMQHQDGRSSSGRAANVTQTPQSQSMHTINDLVISLGIDNINLFRVLQYCRRSEIGKKLNGFVDRLRADRQKDKGMLLSTAALLDPSSESSALPHLEAFLDALNTSESDGRLLVTSRCSDGTNASSMRFLLLNTSVHFQPVLRDARAVILCGGTLHPTSELSERLDVAGKRAVRLFSCGHVIPPGNLRVLVVGTAPSGSELKFTYATREDTGMMASLGQTLLNACRIVPQGIVCFFPSYDFEERAFAAWSSSSLIASIEKVKRVFREPRESSQTDALLKAYSDAAISSDSV